MGKFKAECPNCHKIHEIKIPGISDLPKSIICKNCGKAFKKEKVPIK